MRVVVITVVKDDLVGLIRTEKSIQTQSAQVSWVLVTPTDSSVTHSHVQELIAKGIVEEVIQDFGDGVYNAMNIAFQRINPNDWIWFLFLILRLNR